MCAPGTFEGDFGDPGRFSNVLLEWHGLARPWHTHVDGPFGNSQHRKWLTDQDLNFAHRMAQADNPMGHSTDRGHGANGHQLHPYSVNTALEEMFAEMASLAQN